MFEESTIDVTVYLLVDTSLFAGKLPQLYVGGYVLGDDPISKEVCMVKDVHRKELMMMMQESSLRQAEARVNKYYGLYGKGDRTIKIKALYDELGGMIEYVKFDTKDGKPYYELGMDMVDFFPPNRVLGGFDFRRVLAHEMVHILMYENFPQYLTYPLWFIEGQAELIHGCHERLANDLKFRTPIQILQFVDVSSYTQANAELVYSAGYLAVRYMHEFIKPDGIITFLNLLRAGRTFNQALSDTMNSVGTGSTAEEKYRHRLKDSSGVGLGEFYFKDIISRGQLKHPDVGAIGGFWVDGGPILSDFKVMDDE